MQTVNYNSQDPGIHWLDMEARTTSPQPRYMCKVPGTPSGRLQPAFSQAAIPVDCHTPKDTCISRHNTFTTTSQGLTLQRNSHTITSRRIKVHSALSENPNLTIRPLALPASKFLKCTLTPQPSSGHCVRQSVTKSSEGDLPVTGLFLRPSDSSPRCSVPPACLSSTEGLT